MTAAQYIHIALELWGAFFCLIAAFCVANAEAMEGERRGFLIAMELTTALILTADAAAWGWRGGSGAAAFYIVRVSNFLAFLATDALALLFHLFTAWCLKLDRGRAAVRLGAALCALGMALVIVSQFTGLYYYIDSDNLYHRARWHFIFGLLGMAVLLLDMALLVKYRKRLTRPVFFAMMSYTVLPVLSSAVLLFYYGVSLFNLAACLSMMFMFVVSMVEQSRELVRRQKELSDLRVSLVLSQVKPHFIYNALTAIRQLCETDPREAAEAVMDFSAYLRGTLDTLDLTEPVTIEWELENLGHYLAIERRRFPELRVEHDIRARGFLLPALSVLTLTENAVKYGLRPGRCGTVRIVTLWDGDAALVRVEDDGPGFDPEKVAARDENGTSHLGLRSVRQRVEAAGGSLRVQSAPGQGTVAELRFPII